MPPAYEIEISYDGEIVDEATLSDANILSWITIQDIDIKQREKMVRIVRHIARWLQFNGGTRIEISEVS